jgi:hypothetical protein
MIKAGGRTLCSWIHELINSIWNMEELPEQWKESITVPTYKNEDKTDCSNYKGISLLSPKIQNSIQCPSDKANSIWTGNYWGPSVWILT